ncbi:Queuosine biosynthesis protein [Candidatus Magnetomorum sp. HK-1]|nr:Queuosine biosynthesis protein [Candidatus Magnetomorum sp. HK-1]
MYKQKAVLLSSGGLDSTTALAIAKHEGFDVYSMSFNYGQRHSFELKAAEKVAETLDVAQHLVINVNMRQIGGSALTDEMDVPKDRSADAMTKDIPVTYVPARNTIFLSYALAWAEVLGAFDIIIGVNAVDYSGYPDCRPEFIDAFEKMANLATKAGIEAQHKIRINAPLIHLTKAQIILKGTELGVDYGITHSCYDPSPDGLACSKCDSCILRRKGFLEAGVEDPTKYAQNMFNH